MSLILDALNRARQLTQGKNSSPEAQNLMKSFGAGPRARRRRTKKLFMYLVPALLLAAGMTYAGNYWLKQKSRASMSTARIPERPEPAAPVPAPEVPPAAALAEQPAAAAPTPATTPAPAAATATKPPTPPAKSVTAAAPPPEAPPPAKPKAPVTPPVRNTPRTEAPADSTPAPSVNKAVAVAPAPVVTPPAAAPAAPPAPVADPARDPHETLIAFLNAGKYPEAVAECKRAVAKYPTSPTEYVNCGIAYTGLGKLDEALDMLTTASRMPNNTATLFIALGNVYLQQRDFAGALGSLERAASLAPNNAKISYNKGLAHKELGAKELAKSSFLDAIRKDPQFPEAHFSLAMLYDEQGEVGKALEAFKNFQRLTGGLPDYRSKTAYSADRIEELEKKIPKAN